MCGIVGYIGPRDVVPILTGGLEKLEYRGYDSAGVAYLRSGEMHVVKTKGKVANLTSRLGGASAENTVGIGHTRWATHGEPSDANAHPHTSTAQDVAIVHNGIIENYAKLKEWLQGKGIRFLSDTDTEVAAHLINYFYESDLKSAVMRAVKMIEGSYALGVICKNEPEKIVAVRKDSPLIVGIGKGENFIASDIPAILEYTRDVYFLEDDEIAVIERDEVRIYDALGNRISRAPYTVDWDVAQAEKSGYEHFMIKEIYEQPKSIVDTLMPRLHEGRIDLTDAGLTEEMLCKVRRMIIVACGTASYAGYIYKYLIEKYARIPVEVDVGSEFRYRDPIFGEDEIVIAISQSGETADTIAAVREARAAGLKIITITNVVGSTLAREADAVIYNRAGMEIAVASTKAYTNQLLIGFMIAMEAGRVRGKISLERYAALVEELRRLPEKIEETLQCKEQIQKLASKRYMEEHAYYIGRGLDYYVALEGTMKLKEVSYIHAEAYTAGELKHGPIALIDNNTLVVAFVTQQKLLDKTMSNMKEGKARRGHVVAVAQERDRQLLETVADEVIVIPDVEDDFAPILSIIPAQMLGYYVSVMKGCDVDKPRNLAKSVTVE